MSESLGAKLRQLREARQMTREQLYNKTKIMPIYIEALENGRWDLLPGPMYVKPFVKGLAEALDAPLGELYAIIDKQSTVAPPQPTAVPEKRGFDYRWPVAVAMIVFACLVIVLFEGYARRRNIERLPQLAELVTPPAKIRTRSPLYSDRLDYLPSPIKSADYHYLEITAIQPANIVLTAGPDTFYSGLLQQGQTIKNRSARRFYLEMDRSDCLDITYNGSNVSETPLVKSKRRIHFEE